MRLDVRLPELGAACKALEVPSLEGNYAYNLLHGVLHPHQGVGRGARPAAEKISEEDRSSKLHCGCCRKPLSALTFKAANKGATYWVCGACDQELRARRACGGQDSKDVWKCPTAAKGDSGCVCWCAVAKKQQVSGGKRPKSKGHTSSKKQKWTTQKKNESQKGDQ